MLITLKFFCKLHRGRSCFIFRKEKGGAWTFIFSSMCTASLAFEKLSEHGTEKLPKSGKKCYNRFLASSFPSALWWLLLRYLLPDCSFCSWDISRFSTRKKVVNVNWAGEVKLYCKVTGFYPGFQWTIGEFVLSSLFTWCISMIMKQYYHPAKWKLLNKRWGSYGGKIKYGWNNIYWSYHQLCRLASRFGGW